MNRRKSSAQGRRVDGMGAALTALLLSILIVAPAAAAPPLPPDFTASFTLSRAGFNVATSSVRLERDGDMVVYSSVTRPAGIVSIFRKDVITERSTLQVAGEELALREYFYHHEGGKKLREALLTVEDDVARGTWRGHETVLDLPPGTLDRFSVQLALMRDLARGNERLEYTAIDNNRVRTFNFVVADREILDLPIGETEAIRVERVYEKDGRYLAIWFAPTLHYLPVRIEQVEDGDGRMVLGITDLEWKSGTSSTR